MSKITSKISSEIKTMIDIFKDDDYNVPFYQRDYAWKREEIVDFWSDLTDVINEEQKSHFFGQVVTYDHSDAQDLIDGQQRITTSAILLAVIKNLSEELLTNELSDDYKLDLKAIVRQIKECSNYKEIKPTLTLQPISKEDNSIHEYFIGLFSGKVKIDEANKDVTPIKNINNAYTQIKNEISAYINKSKVINERINRLKLVFNSFFNKFYVSMISTPNPQDAFVIFETLNSRGKDLEPAEIIKTHIMSQLSSEDKDAQLEFQGNWNKMSNKLGKDSDKLTRFIRTYWASSHRLVSSRQLYRSISNNILNENDSKNFIQDLNNLVELYIIISKRDHTNADKNFIDNNGLLNIATLLRRMQVKLYYPIIFAMYRRNFDSNSIKIVLHKILCVFIRHRTICNDGTNKLETGYSNIAKDIWNQKLTNADEINKCLNEKLLKTDNEITASFQALQKDYSSNGAKHWTLSYLLFYLYQQTYEDFESYMFSDIDISKYKIINIGNVEDIDENYIQYIGNYAIIEDSLSTNILGVDSALRRSKLKGNNKIGNIIKDNGWGINQIINRQKEFSKSAINIW
ncbi:DUF262 domain-containing protein [Apilactobacillus sp. M161]|uniref:DUF262 domain-containing protein n=1 Tax=Apilactobacillus xinyiensis TaxID=2841032 RepID=A0ABT0I1I4_9LACO|nr:DUF262 domain-containing protein [Apilactobacillus xinyiensis]MCK8624575.1 DUF262 domain-containing protein [Apilactobacillus xinyiensis]